MGELWELPFSSMWRTMKLWQKALVLLAVIVSVLSTGLIALNQGHEFYQWVTYTTDTPVTLIPETHFVDDEILRSSDQILTLAHAPNPSSSLQLKWNGMELNSGKDFTVSGNLIALIPKKEPSEELHAFYRY
jgi:hypothetical protein